MLIQLFNGITFAGSMAVFWGVADPTIIKITGDTTMFLLSAGMAGAVCSSRQLLKPRMEH